VSSPDGSRAGIHCVPFGQTADGIGVELYVLRNGRGMEARIATYGGIVTFLNARDRMGHYEDVVLGHDALAPYLDNRPYFGALIGRYANRIARGRFLLNGAACTLATNDPPHSLHGGRVGFDKVVWEVSDARVTPNGPRLALRYLSRDGEEGYPGNLAVSAVYTLMHEDTLRLEYHASTDRLTVVNLTQHSYFNLRGGQDRSDILGHVVQIDAERFTPVDRTLIPTGELRRVEATPFDFRQPTAIDARIDDPDEQLQCASGYDHNWVLNKQPGTLAVDATVYEPASGRLMEVASTQPGLQFYTGNLLEGTIKGKGGRTYHSHAGFCMESQHFPDSPNHPGFPSTELEPGQTYRNTILLSFTTRSRT
jgi:aldose 1-epimerase